MNSTAKDQAAAQYDSIVFMLGALSLDWDRLRDLRDTEDLSIEDQEEVEALELMRNDCEDEDDARQVLEASPLSVEIRSGWYAPGEDPAPAEEFQILLCTGGPAVRIMGTIDHRGAPDRAWLEFQDWGTPWTQYFEAKSDVLVDYASHFVGIL
jgi:hypothetical protein